MFEANAFFQAPTAAIPATPVPKADPIAAKASDKMIDEARMTINAEKQAAIREIKNQVVELSLQISERLLKKNLSKDKDQKKLIKEYIKDLKLN